MIRSDTILTDVFDEHIADLDAHVKDANEVLRTGRYHFGYPAQGSGTVTISANTLYCLAFLASRAITVDRIAVYVQTAGVAGTAARLGIYENGDNCYPGDLLVDAGTVAVDSTGNKTITISQSLTKGIYWLSLVSDGAPTFYREMLVISPLGVTSADQVTIFGGWSVSQTYGSLPDPFTTGGTVLQLPPAIRLRLKSLD
jgi:hypothetical protein